MTRHAIRLLACASAALILTCAPALAARDAREIVTRLDGVIAQAAGRKGDPDYRAFLAAVAQGYGVSDLGRLAGRVHVGLFSDVVLSDQLRYYGVGSTESGYSAASTLKVAVLCLVLSDIEQGRMALKGSLAGQSVETHLKRMCGQSNNDSANLLLQAVGIERANAWLAALGFGPAELHFGRYFTPTGLGFANEYNRRGGEVTASAAALAELYFLLAQDEDLGGFLTKASLRQAKALLQSNGQVNNRKEFNDRLNGSFPRGVSFTHKTGSNAGVVGDGGIVRVTGADGKPRAGDLRFIMTAYDTGKDRGAMRKLGLALLEWMQGR